MCAVLLISPRVRAVDLVRVDNSNLGLGASPRPLIDGAGNNGILLLSRKFLVLGDPATSVLGSLSGVAIGGVGTQTTTLNKTAHGLVLVQGDVIVITSCTTAANIGAYLYTGMGQANSIEIGSVLSGSDTDIALTAYRGVTVWGPNGVRHVMHHLTQPYDAADVLCYDVDQTSGEGRGLEIFFGSPLSHWGDGEASQFPINIYRNLYREGSIFKVDATGQVIGAAGIKASGGIVASAGSTASPLPTAPTAPTITPANGTGSTTWSYKVAPLATDGSCGIASAEGTTAVGVATLTTAQFNQIGIPYAAGVYAWGVWRTAAGGSPSSLGYIGSVIASLKPGVTKWFWDTGQAGDGTAPPTGNRTGTAAAYRRTFPDAHRQEVAFDRVVLNNTPTVLYQVAIGSNDTVQTDYYGSIQVEVTEPSTGKRSTGLDYLRWVASSHDGVVTSGFAAGALSGNAPSVREGSASLTDSVTLDTATPGVVKVMITIASSYTSPVIHVKGLLKLNCLNEVTFP
jgi:hypothetical protein